MGSMSKSLKSPRSPKSPKSPKRTKRLAAFAGVFAAVFLWGQAPARAEFGAREDLSPDAKVALNRLETAVGGKVKVLVRRDASRRGGERVGRVTMARGFRIPMRGESAEERARAFITRYGELLGLDDLARQVQHRRSFKWAAGEVVRFRVSHDGRRIFGHEIAVRLRGRFVTAITGGLPPVDRWEDPRTLATRADVERFVLEATGRRPSRVFGVGYLLDRGEGVLVWRADQYTLRGEKPQRFLLAVEDRTGLVRMVGQGFVEATGKAYDPTPENGPPVEVELTDLVSDVGLEGAFANAWQCVGDIQSWPPCSPLEHGATPDASGDYLYDPIEPSNSDSFAEVHAYYHATSFNKWLEDYLGFAWECAGSRAIDVHVNMDYENAFYGDANADSHECADITLGQSGVDFAYDAEVLFHEFTHGMVDQTAMLGCPAVGLCMDNLGVNMMPMGLNEGFADYYSMTYTDDPDIGEYVSGEYGDPHLRTALNTNQCPWDVTAESHHDGQILSGAAWTFRNAFGVETGDKLLYGTLLSLPQDADFASLAENIVEAAEDMQDDGILTAADVSLVQETVGPNDRNMTDCSRVIPLDNRPPGKEDAYGYGMQTYPGYLDELPVSLHWTAHVPHNGVSLRFNIYSMMGYGSSWRVFLNKDEPALVQVTMQGTQVEADYEFNGSPDTIELDSTTDPPLERDTTYHMVIVYSAQWGEFFQVSADVETGVVEPDAGVVDAAVVVDAGPQPDAGEPDAAAVSPDGSSAGPDGVSPRNGCECRATGAASASSGTPGAPLALLLLGLFVAGLVLRRRR